MKITRFQATNVYGYMNLNVNFNDDLTFLTGINGSGKTTVVKGISALVTPSLITMSHMDYERMEVDLQDKKRKIKVWTKKNTAQFMMGCSTTKDTLSVQVLSLDSTEPSYRLREKEIDYYREFEAQNSNHPVLKVLKELPTPMSLGIERRYSEFLPTEEGFPPIRFRRRPPGMTPSMSYNPLQSGLLQAAALAEFVYRKIQAQQKELTDELRKNILLDAFRYEEVGGKFKLEILNVRDRNIEDTKKIVQSTYQSLGLPSRDVELQLEPFFNKIKELSEILKDEHDLDQIIKRKDSKKVQAAIEWIINYPQFDRINRILSFVESYIKESRNTNEQIDRYLKIVNSFLQDSMKEIKFDETGTLTVTIPGGKLVPITSLSSGESQILVIITHLSLNPAAQLANVFIVDEPELSLHIRWQELFVKAIQEASPKLQLILATHSPSIILDNTEKCVDLSEMTL